MFLEISQNSPEDTCARVSFLIKLQVTGVFLWILQNFYEHLFYRTPLDDCFWILRKRGFNFQQKYFLHDKKTQLSKNISRNLSKKNSLLLWKNWKVSSVLLQVFPLGRMSQAFSRAAIEQSISKWMLVKALYLFCMHL